MGTVNGKLGDMVFYRRKGSQQQRAYIKKMFDANTRSQVEQRSQLANVVCFYRSAKRLLNHSFTDAPSNQSSYNAFVSANLNKVNVYLPKSIADKNGCIVAPYQISKGSLSPIQITGAGDDATTNIALGSLTISATTTIADFTAALLANNTSILEGDQLSYISCVQGQDVQLGIPIMTVGYYEVTLSLANTELLLSYMPEQAVANKSGFLGHGSHVNSGGFAWILSRKTEEGKIVASPQVLILNDFSTLINYQGTVAIDRAVSSYNATEEPFLDPGSDSESANVSLASVSSVKIGSTTLTPGSTYNVSISNGTSTVTINGSNLGDISTVALVINGVSYNLTDVTATDTKITGTLTTTSAISATAINVRLNGSVAYTWTVTSSSSGDQGADPLGD